MLAIEKENLLAATNREIAQLRESEFKYYIDQCGAMARSYDLVEAVRPKSPVCPARARACCSPRDHTIETRPRSIGSIQTMATLLAGFSFAAVVQTNTLNLVDANDVFFLTNLGVLEKRNETAGTSFSTTMYGVSHDGWKYLSFFMRALELVCFILTLGEMLHVMTEALIARQLGSRLALRGPDGSIIQATRNLALALSSATRSFFQGLQYFILSVSFYTLRAQHPLVAIILNAILYRYWRKQGDLAGRLTAVYHVRQGTTTAFADDDSDCSETVPPIAVGATAASSSFRKRMDLASGMERTRTLKRRVIDYINPVGHHLKFLTKEVANDFEGVNSIARGRHRNPEQATKALIARAEKRAFQTISENKARLRTQDGLAIAAEGDLGHEFAKGWLAARNAAELAAKKLVETATTPLRLASGAPVHADGSPTPALNFMPAAGCTSEASDSTDTSATRSVDATPSDDEVFGRSNGLSLNLDGMPPRDLPQPRTTNGAGALPRSNRQFPQTPSHSQRARRGIGVGTILQMRCGASASSPSGSAPRGSTLRGQGLDA